MKELPKKHRLHCRRVPGSSSMTIRDEDPADHDAVRHVNETSFGRPDEARLVDRLRKEASPIISLIAEINGAVVGHILFTPVRVECAGNDNWLAMALGPMAVLPAHQRQGVGGALIQEGLVRCTAINTPAVFVLGHPEYYPRFSFVPASQYGWRCTWAVPDEVFMVVPLRDTLMRRGLVRYHEAFERAT